MAQDLAPVRVLIVDDHELVRRGVVSMLADESRIRVVGEAADGAAAIHDYKVLRPDVLLVDLRMPDVPGDEVIRQVRAFDRQARIIVLSSFASDAHVARARRAGAATLLPKDIDAAQLRACILDVADDRLPRNSGAPFATPEIRLTAREAEVLQLLADGRANKEIASALGISESTAKLHLKNMFVKLGVNSRTQALRRALELDLLNG